MGAIEALLSWLTQERRMWAVLRLSALSVFQDFPQLHFPTFP